MPPTVSDLFLAFRQAKAGLYFERRGLGLIELAKFEHDLSENLERLRATLTGNGGWFDHVPIGNVWVVPKRIRLPPIASLAQAKYVGSPGRVQNQAPPDLDVQLRLTPSPEFAIVEVLFLWRFGPAIDSLLSRRDALGYRLDLRDGRLNPTGRWLFEYWPKAYQRFRTEPLAIARAELARASSATIVSADFASFYDSIDPSFLIDQAFQDEIRVALAAHGQTLEEYHRAVHSLLRAIARYHRIAKQRTGLTWSTGVPIGALTSRLIANAALASFDTAVAGQAAVVGYRRYVDDFVIVGRGQPADGGSPFEIAQRFIPNAEIVEGTLRLNAERLRRAGSDLVLQPIKMRAYHLHGPHGEDFLRAIEADFRHLVSEGRAFLDPDVLAADGAARAVRAGGTDGAPLRVLRDADRTKLRRIELWTTLRSLDRSSILLDPDSARKLTRKVLRDITTFLSGEIDWVANLDPAFHLLRLGVATENFRAARQLNEWMDSIWASVVNLQRWSRDLFHRDRKVVTPRAWTWMRNYLHECRLEAVASALRPPSSQLDPWLREGLQLRTSVARGPALLRRARDLAASDLRARDREDDSFGANPIEHEWRFATSDPLLQERFERIQAFVGRCEQLEDAPWQLAPARLFLCTRPPSYFDIARRWLYRTEQEGFGPQVFEELLDVVNAIRGTRYRDPVGEVVDEDAVAIPTGAGSAHVDPRLILGNLVVSEDAWTAAASRSGRSPLLTTSRLSGLAILLARAAVAARQRRRRERVPALLLLPELSLPRRWFREVANHVARSGDFGLVVGLEYRHDPSRAHVYNQVHAVLPGAFGSVATWPWTKQFPAREEAEALGKLSVPLSFGRFAKRRRPVVRSPYGSLSVLICSELIEPGPISDLFGRVELVLVPSWNRDTSSYDHLIQSAGLQLHSIVAIANNGSYSDCRAWAPRNFRWERDLCRLIERDVNDVVTVDVPLRSLRAFRLHASRGSGDARRRRATRDAWRPLPPGWPDD